MNGLFKREIGSKGSCDPRESVRSGKIGYVRTRTFCDRVGLGAVRYFCVVISGVMIAGCTHVDEPKVTTTERSNARTQLKQWPGGTIVFVSGNDGVKLKARLYRPPGRLVATMVAMHGIETHSKWFAPLARELNKKGIAVLAMDRRGSGLNRGITGKGQMEKGQTYEMWLQDILENVKLARSYGAKVYVIGNSWGGNPILAWAEKKEAQMYANGVVLLTPGLASFKPTTLQQVEILLARDDTLLGTCLSVEDYSRQRSTWALLEEDGMLTKEVAARFFRQTRMMRGAALEGLGSEKLPVLLICAQKDDLMKNAVMINALRSGLPAGLFTEHTLDNDYHLALIEDPERVASTIVVWIEAHEP